MEEFMPSTSYNLRHLFFKMIFKVLIYIALLQFINGISSLEEHKMILVSVITVCLLIFLLRDWIKRKIPIYHIFLFPDHVSIIYSPGIWRYEKRVRDIKFDQVNTIRLFESFAAGIFLSNKSDNLFFKINFAEDYEISARGDSDLDKAGERVIEVWKDYRKKHNLFIE